MKSPMQELLYQLRKERTDSKIMPIEWKRCLLLKALSKTFTENHIGEVNEMVANQTAMEQFIEWIDSDCTPLDCVMKAKELLKIEQQQITKASEDTFNSTTEYYRNGALDSEAPLFGKQYYNEKYGIK